MSAPARKVLVFADYFAPAYKAGGGIRLFERIAREADPEREILIVTQDHDWADARPLAGVPANEWIPYGQARVRYVDASRRLARHIRALIRRERPDVIHLNSLFSRVWTIKVLLLRALGLIPACRVLLSPHGELAPAALGLKSIRKRLFLSAAKRVGLLRGVEWVATCEPEARAIREEFGSSTAVSIWMPYPPAPVAARRMRRKEPGALALVFLARLTAMKNIQHVLKLLPRVAGRVSLDVYGPVDPGYRPEWERLLARARREGARVAYHGAIEPDRSAGVLARYDLLVQPSWGENFGFSILEALAAGTPVLISDRTPWTRVGREGAGAAVPLEDEGAWLAQLGRFAAMRDEEWRDCSERARRWLEALRAEATGQPRDYGESRRVSHPGTTRTALVEGGAA